MVPYMYKISIVIFLIILLPIWGLCSAVLVQQQDRPEILLGIGEECSKPKTATTTTTMTTGWSSSSKEIVDEFGFCNAQVRLECVNGRCQCKKGFTINHNGSSCLEIARNGLASTCEEDVQCWKGLLGRMSECDVEMGKCTCYESESVPIVFHQGRCYYGEGLGDYCQIDGLCSTTTSNASCRAGICQCRHNFVSSWDKSRCLPIATNGLNSSCEENIQCEKSGLGTLSECNQERMECQCYHIPQISTIYYAGRCYFTASLLGDVCQVGPQCDTKIKNSHCGADGKCACLESEGYLPAGNNTACELSPSLMVLDPDNGSSSGSTANDDNPKAECLDDSSCAKIYGQFGFCNASRGKCECFNQNPSHNGTGTSGSGLEMIKCLVGKQLGEPCKYSRQCQAMNSGSTCIQGSCTCIEQSHVLAQDGRKCLLISSSDTGSTCDEDAQCTKSSLGPLSICLPRTGICGCTDLLPMSMYGGRCYFQRWIGSFCGEHDECRASMGTESLCTSEGKCQCGPGFELNTSQTCAQIPEPSAAVDLELYSTSGTGIGNIWEIFLIVFVPGIVVLSHN